MRVRVRSIFYVFYDQYLHIVDDAVMNLLVCLAAVCVGSVLLTGLQVCSALWITANCASILLSMLAYMALLQIELNALSLVNLVVVRAFSSSKSFLVFLFFSSSPFHSHFFPLLSTRMNTSNR